jgi:hypothetical protein
MLNPNNYTVHKQDQGLYSYDHFRPNNWMSDVIIIKRRPGMYIPNDLALYSMIIEQLYWCFQHGIYVDFYINEDKKKITFKFGNHIIPGGINRHWNLTHIYMKTTTISNISKDNIFCEFLAFSNKYSYQNFVGNTMVQGAFYNKENPYELHEYFDMTYVGEEEHTSLLSVDFDFSTVQTLGKRLYIYHLPNDRDNHKISLAPERGIYSNIPGPGWCQDRVFFSAYEPDRSIHNNLRGDYNQAIGLLPEPLYMKELDEDLLRRVQQYIQTL